MLIVYNNAIFLFVGLMEVQLIGKNFQSLLSAVYLHKCIQARYLQHNVITVKCYFLCILSLRVWENSKHVTKQLDKIGLSLSTTLVNAGLTTFQKMLESNPREIELVCIVK